MVYMGSLEFGELLGLFFLSFAIGAALGCIGDSTTWKAAMCVGFSMASGAEVLMLALDQKHVLPWITAKALGFSVLVCGAFFLGFSSARMSRDLKKDG